MKKKIISVMLVSAMVASMFAGCGNKEEGSKGGTEASTSGEGSNTLKVWAWDANFNNPALKAAGEDYKKNVDPNFELVIEEQSQSKDIEDAITLAGSAGDYSTLPDIVLFQDHYFKQYQANYPDAWLDVNDAEVDWADFGAEKLDYSTVDGTHFGFPVDNGTVFPRSRNGSKSR